MNKLGKNCVFVMIFIRMGIRTCFFRVVGTYEGIPMGDFYLTYLVWDFKFDKTVENIRFVK